eukprot:TRINITY_DN6895_c0_g1_i2.p1 TRINITY_DN6895_c0_g1~~TRINITY_DN6895_c0_g1_i2.p1  ORF type:complete len:153 (-),score=22.16 TRINITY_DN6895_c0_g1_i2:14-472(-)
MLSRVLPSSLRPGRVASAFVPLLDPRPRSTGAQAALPSIFSVGNDPNLLRRTRMYLVRLHCELEESRATVVHATALFQRLMIATERVLSALEYYGAFVATTVIAAKMLHDPHRLPTNAEFARLSGLKLGELNCAELTALEALVWDVDLDVHL